jgi:16S rRNA (guanine966-N2)-methyltransferase
MTSSATVLRMEVEAALAGPLRTSGPFDLVLLDPPYGTGDLGRALALLSPSLSPGALVVGEHASRDAPPCVEGLALQETRRYGDTAISFYGVQETRRA